MAQIDVDALLTPVSESLPCGPDLEYDAQFLALEEAARGKAEQQFGDTIIAAEEPDWRTVQSLSEALLARTKDLRVAVHLLRASTRLEGLGACADGLRLIAGLLATQWDHVHPMLDVDDGNDPTMRLNALAPLVDGQGLLADIRKSALSAGRHSVTGRDIELASGKAQPHDGESVPALAGVVQAFQDAEAQQPGLLAKLSGLVQSVAQIDQVIQDKASISGPELRPLRLLCQHIVDTANQAQAGATSSAAGDAAAVPDQAVGGPAAATAVAVPGAIRTRADAIAALQKVCEWIELNEPTNPAPLLIRRAERLMNKSFMDIIRDLVPDGIDQVERIAGPSDQ
ncbi:MAG: type VI secretion system protein TssA [Acidobacteriota bacterium]